MLIYNRGPIGCSNPEPRSPTYVNVPVTLHFASGYLHTLRGPDGVRNNSASTYSGPVITGVLECLSLFTSIPDVSKQLID